VLTRVLSRENRINDEHDAKPPFTRDLDLLASHWPFTTVGRSSAYPQRALDEVDPKKVATVRFGIVPRLNGTHTLNPMPSECRS